MQDIQGTLMAAWRATGGAIAAVARPETAAADDGLIASVNTGRYPTCADDGLAASMRSTGGWDCFADDGLTASVGTGHFPMCADDGLTASAYSNRWPRCIGN